jgi:hypothetical protein
MACLLTPLPPAFDGADANAEEAGRLDLRETGVNRSQQPLAEVGRVLLHRHSLPLAHLFRKSL